MTQTNGGGWVGSRGEDEVVNSTNEQVQVFIRGVDYFWILQKSRKPDFQRTTKDITSQDN